MKDRNDQSSFSPLDLVIFVILCKNLKDYVVGVVASFFEGIPYPRLQYRSDIYVPQC